MGDKGKPVDLELRVVQVISDQSFLAGLYYYDGGECKISDAMIVGMDTSELIDNRLLQCREEFECTGTFKYGTVGGSYRTVPLLRKIQKELK